MVKVIFVHVMKTYSGSRRVTSALNGGEWLTSCLGLFIAGKELRYTLDSPRAGLYVVEKGGKCLPSSGFEPWTIHTVACLLYRLSYSFVEFLRPCVVYVRTYVIHTHTHTHTHTEERQEGRDVPCGRTDGQPDMTKLIIAFRNFSNGPKIKRGG